MESLTQMECTQEHSQQVDETPTPLSPPPPLPWARLVPCVPSVDNAPIELLVGQHEYWLGRSSRGIQIKPRRSLVGDSKENAVLDWAHSTISNRHCRIAQIRPPLAVGGDSSQSPIPPTRPQIVVEDRSGNGTFVNQTVHLAKGHQRILHSGDEICLINPHNLRKKTISARILRNVLQQYTYVLVLSNRGGLGHLPPPQRGGGPPCVNPRAMNYHSGTGRKPSDSGAASPRSARRIEAHYELREVLGDGTSGQVRRAIHRHSGKEYAVKVISLRRHLDLTSMEHEVTMMQSLDHPYIVQLVDVFVHHGIAMYLVMELVSGGDLFDRIVQQERYSEVDARRVMRRLLSAIYYLHQTKQVVHRDLKPENVLCSSPTSVKLADFGLAKMIQSDGLKTFCGTPQYFAPEVLQRRTTVAGSGRYGKPADMRSLGVILYLLLAGRPPFEADLDPLQAFDALEFEQAIWNGMPHARELVEHMLRLDPKRRITVRQACDHPWINTEDGDTHVHPLDDPAVTGRKRLFSESSDKQPVAKDTGEKPISDETSVTSKDSVLSNEGFAAAANSLCRGDSIQYTDVYMADASAHEDDPGEDGDATDAVVNNGEMDVEMAIETSPNLEENNSDNIEKCNIAPETKNSTSPDVELKCEASVTPSTEPDDGDVPRSPLAAMNLNARSNGFRVQVLGQERSSADRTTNQVAVTPTASNVRSTAVDKTRNHNHHNNNDASDVEDDPILSQFSSEPSSVDSFPDSPTKDRTPAAVTEKVPNVEKDDHHDAAVGKRKRNEQAKNEKEEPAETKGGNQKLVVQKKLSDWFVAKKPKIGSKLNF